MRFFNLKHLVVMFITIITFSLLPLCNKSLAENGKFINDYFKDYFKGKFLLSIQIRHRFEYRNNFDFNSEADDQTGFHLLRTRLNLDFRPIEHLRLFIQLQDSRIYEHEFSKVAAFADDADFRQAYIELKNLMDLLSIRLGRQELAYEEEHLIGGFNWSNVAQSFDGVKLNLKINKTSTDLFWARKVIIDTHEWNESNEEDNLYGLYSKLNFFKKNEIDLFYFYRNTEVSFGPNVGKGKLNESTIGLRASGKKLLGFDYTVLFAYQFGDFGEQDINAYALILKGGYTFKIKERPIRLGIEYDSGSGDKSPTDNERNTFDNLFPTNHKFYGYMDRMSLQNIDNISFRISSKLFKKTYLQVDYHVMRLNNIHDSLYNAGRKAYRTAEDPSISKSVGDEIDFIVKYKFSKNIMTLLGYSKFLPGNFLEATGPADKGEFFYLQTIINL